MKNQFVFVIRGKSGSKFWMKVGFYSIRRNAFLHPNKRILANTLKQIPYVILNFNRVSCSYTYEVWEYTDYICLLAFNM